MSAPVLDPAAAIASSERFRLSPLVQITLVNLYLALTVPLPVLAWVTQKQAGLAWGLAAGLMVGLVALVGALSEQVVLTEDQIQVRYGAWVPTFFRSGWQLPWADVQDLQCRTTGQGGLVYYLVTAQRDRAYLLPMRVAGFNRLTQRVMAKTGLDTRDVRPLSQPWMYLLLLVFTLGLWGMELATAVMVWPMVMG